MTTIVITALLLVLLAWHLWHRAWWLPGVSYRHPRILMYHMISETPPHARFRGLRVAPRDFERQLRYLRDHHWQFLTMSELMSYGDHPPERSVAITFDDGYEDNLTQALPLLEQYGAKATLYLVVHRHQRDWSRERKAHHDSGELGREPKLSDEQVRRMIDSGRIELGAHSLTHPNLARLDDKARHNEIAGSREELERRFATPVTSFAYPFGIYTAADVRAVREAGYHSAVTVEEGVESQPLERAFELRRVKVSGKDSLWSFRLRLRRGIRGVRR